MPNVFCCRGKLGAIPLVVAGFSFFIAWHYLGQFYAMERHESHGVFNQDLIKPPSIRGSALSAEELDMRIEALERGPERDVMKESHRRPDHIIDAEAEEELEERIGQKIENEVMAADEANEDVDESALKMLNKAKVDRHAGKVVPKVRKVDPAERASELGNLIKDVLKDGAVAPEDGMKFIDEESNTTQMAHRLIMPTRPHQVAPVADKAVIVVDVVDDRPALPAAAAAAANNRDEIEELMEFVQFDISIDGLTQPPMIFKMYKDEAPITVRNFETLCEGYTNEAGSYLQYSGVAFHRIIKDFMMQGGQFLEPGFHSLYGNEFDDEASALKIGHSKAGLLSMANHGKNTNSSQFFVTFKPTPHLDGHHAVFGELVKGMEILEMVNELEINNDKTVVPVVLEKCQTHSKMPLFEE